MLLNPHIAQLVRAIRLIDDNNLEHDQIELVLHAYGHSIDLLLDEDLIPPELDAWEDELQDRELENLGAREVQLRLERLREWIQYVPFLILLALENKTDEFIEFTPGRMAVGANTSDRGPHASCEPTRAGLRCSPSSLPHSWTTTGVG